MTADATPNPDTTTAIYRILDANLNRCLEGLRVVEEHLRFVWEDGHLASACKQLRHDVVASLSGLERNRLHAARDIAHDVGASIRTRAEYRRSDLTAVVVANWRRVEQALRSLEEYAKLLATDAASGDLAARLETLRYRAYALERATSLLEHSRSCLDTARLYVLLDGVPVAATPPWADRYVIGPRPGRYGWQWRSFLGDLIDKPTEVQLPARITYGAVDAGAPPGTDGGKPE